MEAPQLEEAHNVLLAGMEEARPGSASPRRIEKRSYLGRWLAAIALFLGIASAVDLGATISYGQAILTGEKTAIIYDDGVQKEETLPLDISESAQSPEEIWNAILRQSEAATPPSLPAITGGSTSRKRKVLISGRRGYSSSTILSEDTAGLSERLSRLSTREGVPGRYGGY